MNLKFQTEMDNSSKKKGSNIILALDFPSSETHTLLSQCIELLETVHPHVCALKINRQLVLPLGLFTGVQRILQLAHKKKLPTIMDCKINDVGHTNRAIAEYYFNAGFDAVTANPFVGWDGGLQPVFEVATQMHRGVVILVYMSHKGAEEGYGQTVQDPKTGKHVHQYAVFAQRALLWKADGVVVGATYPEKIREVHAILRDQVPIYAPGVGAQGGDVGSTVKAGARYLIVGREITANKSPEISARNIRDAAKRYLEK